VATSADGRIARRSGVHDESAGISSSDPSDTNHTRWRAIAEPRSIVRVTARAASRMRVAFTRIMTTERPALAESPEKIAGIVRLPPALPSAADTVAEIVDFGVRHVCVRHPEQGCHGLFSRAAEVGADDVFESVVAGFLGWRGGEVDIAGSVFLILDELFFAQDSED
jgi:hypothetical protein